MPAVLPMPFTTATCSRLTEWRSLETVWAVYFLANTLPVAGIIAWTENTNPFAMWHKVFLWSFPNYVIGAGLTAIVSLFSTVTGLAAVAALMVVSKNYN